MPTIRRFYFSKSFTLSVFSRFNGRLSVSHALISTHQIDFYFNNNSKWPTNRRHRFLTLPHFGVCFISWHRRIFSSWFSTKFYTSHFFLKGWKNRKKKQKKKSIRQCCWFVFQPHFGFRPKFWQKDQTEKKSAHNTRSTRCRTEWPNQVTTGMNHSVATFFLLCGSSTSLFSMIPSCRVIDLFQQLFKDRPIVIVSSKTFFCFRVQLVRQQWWLNV